MEITNELKLAIAQKLGISVHNINSAPFGIKISCEASEYADLYEKISLLDVYQFAGLLCTHDVHVSYNKEFNIILHMRQDAYFKMFCDRIETR